jgi:hypothetical protein
MSFADGGKLWSGIRTSVLPLTCARGSSAFTGSSPEARLLRQADGMRRPWKCFETPSIGRFGLRVGATVRSADVLGLTKRLGRLTFTSHMNGTLSERGFHGSISPRWSAYVRTCTNSSYASQTNFGARVARAVENMAFQMNRLRTMSMSEKSDTIVAGGTTKVVTPPYRSRTTSFTRPGPHSGS